MAEEIDFENWRISNFKGLVTLTLTLYRVIRHTVVHHSSTSTYIPNFIRIGKTFCGRTDVRTVGHLTHVIRSTLRSRPKNWFSEVERYWQRQRASRGRWQEELCRRHTASSGTEADLDHHHHRRRRKPRSHRALVHIIITHHHHHHHHHHRRRRRRRRHRDIKARVRKATSQLASTTMGIGRGWSYEILCNDCINLR